MDTCETCRFGHILWRKGDKFTAYSEYSYENWEHERLETRIECRKYAPRGPVMWRTDTMEVAMFPPMNGETDWCGEHALIKQPTPPPPHASTVWKKSTVLNARHSERKASNDPRSFRPMALGAGPSGRV